MARIKYLTDEHVPSAVAKGLRARGVDVITPPEAGTLGNTDELLLTYARELGRVVITYDADFLRLHDAGIAHAGIVYGTADLSIGVETRVMGTEVDWQAMRRFRPERAVARNAKVGRARHPPPLAPDRRRATAGWRSSAFGAPKLRRSEGGPGAPLLFFAVNSPTSKPPTSKLGNRQR